MNGLGTVLAGTQRGTRYARTSDGFKRPEKGIVLETSINASERINYIIKFKEENDEGQAEADKWMQTLTQNSWPVADKMKGKDKGEQNAKAPVKIQNPMTEMVVGDAVTSADGEEEDDDGVDVESAGACCLVM